MASQIKELGCVYLSRHVYSAKYGNVYVLSECTYIPPEWRYRSEFEDDEEDTPPEAPDPDKEGGTTSHVAPVLSGVPKGVRQPPVPPGGIEERVPPNRQLRARAELPASWHITGIIVPLFAV